MDSPMKNHGNNKKMARKPSAFSQPATQTEVGEFKAGYFVMPDVVSTNNKDVHEHSYKRNNNNFKQERSPGRRTKHQTNESNASPPSPNMKEHRTNPKFEQEYVKKPQVSPPTSPYTEITKKQELLTPHNFPAPVMKMYNYDRPQGAYQAKDTALSTSPSNSERWAGPAFGNAPHPSTLPLPEFPPMPTTPKMSSTTAPITISAPAPVLYHQSPSVQQFFSLSPPQEYASPAMPQLASPAQYASSQYSAIPSAPFPYVGQPSTPLPAPADLHQLSSDLRRLLNLGGGLASPSSGIWHDPAILVVNSS